VDLFICSSPLNCEDWVNGECMSRDYCEFLGLSDLATDPSDFCDITGLSCVDRECDSCSEYHEAYLNMPNWDEDVPF